MIHNSIMSSAKPKRQRREVNVEATRAALVAIARKHFARAGYSRTEIARIAGEARVTTGAIYHHFSGKKALFQAVAEQIEGEILAKSAKVETDDPWLRLKAAFETLIDFCASPDVQRIIFVEAPQVIGPQAWREIELRYAFGALRKVLPELIDAGIVKPYPVDLIAKVMLALLREAAAEIARSKHDPKIRGQVVELAAAMLNVLAAH